MTDGFVTADPAAWASALSELQDARNAPTEEHAAIKGNADEADDRLFRAEDALLDLHAPDLPAVIEKLMVIFDEALWDESPASSRKQIVIGDLHRISAQQA